MTIYEWIDKFENMEPTNVKFPSVAADMISKNLESLPEALVAFASVWMKVGNPKFEKETPNV